MSMQVERAKPRSESVSWNSGWKAHALGDPRTECYLPGEMRRQWMAGWDARHRLCVIEASGQVIA